MFVSVVIPALNEEEPIAEVVRGCLATGIPHEVIVVDNGSTDRTAERAREAGARVVEAQSDCPFRATALFRLDTQPWPSLPEGLDAAERGTLVHETMAAFWRKVDRHAALAELASDAVAEVVAGCAAQARARLPATRWARLPVAVAAGSASSARIRGSTAAMPANASSSSSHALSA